MMEIQAEFYKKVFPDDHTRELVQQFVGSILVSGNTNKVHAPLIL